MNHNFERVRTIDETAHDFRIIRWARIAIAAITVCLLVCLMVHTAGYLMLVASIVG